MTIALYPFMVLAAIGLLLSLGVHIMTLALLPIPGGGTVWALHIGIFVVWIPTVLVARRMTRQASRRDFWRATLRGCPGWMRTGVHIFFGYARPACCRPWFLRALDVFLFSSVRHSVFSHSCEPLAS